MKLSPTQPLAKTPNLSKLTLLAVSVGGVLLPAQSQAFLNDTSRQQVVMIGKGGADSMQAITVNTPQYYNAPTQGYANEYTPALPSTSYGNYNGGVTNYSTTTYTPNQGQSQSYNNTSSSQYGNQYSTQNVQYTTQYNNPSQSQPSTSYATQNQFERLALTTNSAAVAVIDMQSGKPVYEKNMDATRSIASITKMMTAMVVVDSLDDMREEISIRPSDLVGAKDASTRLKAGDRLSRSEFMLMMLMKSENPAAKALASNYHGGYSAFIDAMNKKAQSLGMYQTRFSDASGLNPRNVSSARDLVLMMREISTNPRYQTIRNFSSVPSYDFHITNYNAGSRVYKANSTSPLVRSGNYAINASKTGFIREAGHCVVMETTVNGRPSIIVLLGAKGSQNRWRDAENILGQLAYRF